MLQESRKSGTRSVDVALAEIQIIDSNVYVERAPRKLREVRHCRVSRCVARAGSIETALTRARDVRKSSPCARARRRPTAARAVWTTASTARCVRVGRADDLK